MSTKKSTAASANGRAGSVQKASFQEDLVDAEKMRVSGDWAKAEPRHFVALYADLHYRVYGVEASWGRDRPRATESAKALLDGEFGGDSVEMAKFVAWAWTRERSKEKWRRDNKKSGGRIGWRLQFGADLLTDYKVELARQGKPVDLAPAVDAPKEEAAVATIGCHLTDSGNAQRFATRHGGDARFVATWGKWLVWDGSVWVEDPSSVRVGALAAEVARSIYAEASLVEDDKARAKVVAWAESSESRGRRDALVDLAKSEHGMAITHDALDRDPWLLVVQNGTLDLRTGVLREHRREDLCTRKTHVAFDQDAACPTWDEFLLRVMGGDRELVGFLRRAAGYSLTGSVREHALLFLYGSGANGKSTFARVLLEALGPYAKAGAPRLLLEKKGEVHSTEQADLFGARVVVLQEIDKDAAWGEQTVKSLTGGDLIKARRMREDFWQFAPSHKFWVCANHRPSTRGGDVAMWRRLKLVPFTVTIPEGERDQELPEKLREELPGILAWAVRGCVEWQASGLKPPAAVDAATAAYRSEEDAIGRFVAERCAISTGARIPSSELYDAYLDWCRDGGEDPESQKKFSKALEEKGKDAGYEKKRGGKGWAWRGIGLRSDEDQPFHLRVVECPSPR